MNRIRFIWHLMAALDGEYGQRIQGDVLGRYMLAPIMRR